MQNAKQKNANRNRESLRVAETNQIVVSPMRQSGSQRLQNLNAAKSGKGLFTEISGMIAAAKERVAVAVNAELTMLYWNVGRRINNEILNRRRAEYGKRIIAELSVGLMAEHGGGWTSRQLFYCMRFAETFPDEGIVNTLCSQLSWSHIRLLLPMDDPLKREFYVEMCKMGNTGASGRFAGGSTR